MHCHICGEHISDSRIMARPCFYDIQLGRKVGIHHVFEVRSELTSEWFISGN